MYILEEKHTKKINRKKAERAVQLHLCPNIYYSHFCMQDLNISRCVHACV